MSIRKFIKRTRLLLEQGLYESRRALCDEDISSSRPVEITQLEERILMSASPAAVAVEAPATEAAAVGVSFDTSNSSGADANSDGGAADTEGQLNDQQFLDFVADSVLPAGGLNSPSDTSADGSDSAARTLELVFIDSGVSNIDQMIADLKSESHADDSRQLEVIVLDSRRDGIAQITAALLQYDGVDGMHIVSHGSDGQVKLGSTTLSLENLETYRSAINAWQHSFSEDADLLFYGCNLAETSAGQELMNQIAAACDCDVAASDDLTGHENLGGDWDLEYTVGDVVTDVVFTSGFEASWYGRLDGTAIIDQTVVTGDVQIKAGDAAGQTFSYTSGDGTYDIAEVGITLYEEADQPFQTVTLSIRNAFDGAILTSASIDSNDMTSTYAEYTFDVADITLNDGQEYVIQIETTGSKIRIGRASGDPYLGGTRLNKDGNIQNNEDLTFRVNRANNITSGLLLHHTFDSDASDSSGNGYHGTLTGGADIDTGSGTNQIGDGKLSLNGSTDYVDFSTHAGAFDNLTEGTIAVWVYHDVNSRDVLFELSDSGDANSRLALFRDSDGSLDFFVREGSTTLLDASTATGVIPQNAWTHVAVTVDAGGNRLYVNGVEQNVSYAVGSAATNAFFADVPELDFASWGVDRYNGSDFTRYFDGFLDDGRVYSRSLAGSDVMELYQTSALNSGLVAHYEFDNDVLSVANDSSGTGNHGAYQNSDNTTVGTVGTLAGDFTGDAAGANQYITIADDPSIDFGTGDFSASFWINTTDAFASEATVIDKQNGGDGFRIYVEAGGVMKVNLSSGGSSGTSTIGTINDGSWHHVTFTRSGGAVKTYLDGSVVSSNSASTIDVSTTAPLVIGAGGDSANDFDGLLDDVRLYSRQLSGSDVTKLASAHNIAPSDLSSGIELNTDGGNDSYLNLTDGRPVLGGLNQLTLEATFQIASVPGGHIPIIDYREGGIATEFGVSVNPDGTLRIVVADGSPRTTAGTYSQLLDGNQHHVAVSWDNTHGDVRFYIDGQYAESLTGVGTSHSLHNASATQLVLGQNPDDAGDLYPDMVFSGTMYDIRVWDEVRSTSEIALNYQNKFDSGSLPTGLVANWQMDGFNGSNEVVDVVSGNNLSIGHAVGAGFTASTPVTDLHVAEHSANGTTVGYVVPSNPDIATNVVADGLFLEAPDPGIYTRYSAAQSIGNWTVESGNVDLLGTVTPTSPMGGRSVELNGNTTGAITQTLSTVAGQEYQLIFEAGGNFSGGQASVSFRASAGGVSQDFTIAQPNGWSMSNPLSSSYSLTFTAQASSTVLSFASLETGSYSAVVADVQVLEVPAAIATILNNDSTLSYDAGTGKFYRFVNTLENFTTQLAAATGDSLKGVNGGLIRIDSHYENDLIRQFAIESGNDIWLGATDANNDGNWNWLDGTIESDDQFWTGGSAGSAAPGFYTPTFGQSEAAGEDFVRMTVDGNWADSSAEGNRAYVVQWDASEVLSNFTFSLSDDAGGRFAVDATTGEITVADGSQLDYEANASHDITVQVKNAAGHSYSAVLSITLDNMREPTSLSVPIAQSVDEDTPLTFSSAGGNAVMVESGSLANPIVTAMLTVDNGFLTLQTTTGITFLDGTFNGSSSLTLSGTESDVNAALEGMQYQGDSNYNGTDTLTVTSGSNPSTEANLYASYDFTSGAVSDDSGNNHDGTIVGDPTFISDAERGDVLTFDGSDRITVSGGTAGLGDEVTISAWVNLDAAEQDNVFLSIGDDFYVTLDESNAIRSMSMFANGYTTGSTSSVDNIAGEGWNHVAATLDNVNKVVILYLNGEEIRQGGFSFSDIDWGVTGSPDISIGARTDGSSSFSGSLDDVRVYDRVLTESEISAVLGDQGYVTENVAISVAAVNDAPSFDNTGNLSLDTISEDDVNNSGDTVAEILASDGGDRVTDADSDPEGIAVFSTSGTNGTWQFNTGSGWTDVGAVAVDNSLLLAATDSLRFNPNGENGDVAIISFAAWDRTTGATGTKVDASSFGGDTAFSDSTDSATLVVTDVNDAPVMTPYSPTYNTSEDAGAFSASVGTLLSSSVSDVDPSAVEGIAVYAQAGSVGTLEYSVNGGSSWQTFDSLSETNATLLRATDLFRYTPDGVSGGTMTLDYYAWDQTSGTPGASANVTTRGGTTAFSSVDDTVTINVTDINDEQVVSTNNGATFDEGSASNTITSAMLETTDADHTSSELTYTITGSPSYGELLLDGLVTTSFTQADINAGRVAYTHYGTEDLADSFSFSVNDGTGSASTGTFSITLNPINDQAVVITSDGGGATASVNVNETVSFVTQVTVSDGDMPGDTMTYSIIGGADQNDFAIDSSGNLTFATPPDYDSPADDDLDNDYTVTVQVSDGVHTDNQAITVTVVDVQGSTLTVTTTSDVDDTGLGASYTIEELYAVDGGSDGFVSLREAITAANGTLGQDTISFAILDTDAGYTGTTGVDAYWEISLTAALPTITESVILDGTSQTSFGGNVNPGTLGAVNEVGVNAQAISDVERPEIAIVGASGFSGFVVHSDDVAVQGFSMYGFSSANAIFIEDGYQDTLIDSNVFGVTPTGISDPGAALNSQMHVHTNGADNGMLSNNILAYSTSTGFFAGNASDDWTITGNQFINSGYNHINGDAIAMGGSTGGTIDGNYITGSSTQAIILSGSTSGVAITDNTIVGNAVGPISGSHVQYDAIAFRSGTKDITVSENIIADNYGAGITVNDGAYDIEITQNLMHGNGTILSRQGAAASGIVAVDLQGTGEDLAYGTAPYYTPNDAGDADTGGNSLQNFPVISAASTDGSQITIDGSFNSLASRTYRLEFFTTQEYANGHGQGEVFLGSVTVTTDGSGDTTFNASFAATIPAESLVTATATDLTNNQTSEYSQQFSVNNAPHIVGTNLVTNSDFAMDLSGWTVLDNADWDANKVRFGQIGGDNGSISQTVTTVIGESYFLTFEYGDFSATHSQSLDVQVVGGTTLLSDSITSGGAENTLQSYTYSFVADSTSTTLTFTDTSADHSGVRGYIDNIEVRADATPPSAINYAENDGAIQINNGFNFADVDDTNLESAVIVISGNYANGEDVLTFVNTGDITGVWDSATGTLTLTGTDTVDSYEAALRSITYTNTSDDPSTLTRTVSFTVNDGDADSNVSTRDINVTAANDAPVLDSSDDLSLTTITEDEVSNGGQTVAQILASDGGAPISDVDSGSVEGIAITARDNGNGQWQYSTDGGTNWSSVGVVSDASALLLRSTDLVRFAPDGENGVSQELTFRAWDQTSGTAGTKVDVSTNGGTTAFSTATEKASIVVTSVNDAPTIIDSSTFTFTGTNEDTNSASSTVSDILTSAGHDDVDDSHLEGMAITSTTGNGTWHYSTDGNTWTAFGGVSASNALLLDADTQIHFSPDEENGETASFGYRAWDQTTGMASSNGATSHGDTTTHGGTTDFSSQTASARITVTDLNDAPFYNASGDTTFTTITEDDLNNDGETVADLIASAGGNRITDVDNGAVEGIAIRSAQTGNGTWQYSLDGGTNWLDVGPVTNSSALLLRDTDMLRFQPNGENGTSAHLSVRAWDQTSGVAGSNVDTGVGGGTTAFGTTPETMYMTVTDVNDAPTLTDAANVSLGGTNEDTASTGSSVASIYASAGGDDVDTGAVSGIAVTSATGNGAWQYSTDGTNWTSFGSVSASNALLLTSTSQVRYQPDGIDGETATFGFQAWDETVSTGSAFNSRSHADATTLVDGTHEFSSESATATMVIGAVNDAVLAVADTGEATEAGGIANATVGSDATGNVLSNDRDIDPADELNVTGVAFGSVASASTNVATSVTGTYGAITVAADGSYTYVVDEDNAIVQALRTSSNTITDTFTYTVTDGGGATSSTQIVITIDGQNDAPVAVADSATAVEAGGLANADAGTNPIGNVLTNDVDVDGGDTKTVTGNVVGAATGAVGASVAGMYGAITINSDGSYSYVVDNDNAIVQALRTSSDTLDDVFSYTLTDSDGATSSTQITVTIQGQNDDPVAVDDNLTAAESGGISNATAGSNGAGNVLTNDTDVDSGDTQSIVGVEAGSLAVASGNVGTGVAGTYGTLSIDASGNATYVVDEDNAVVQALRTAGDTVSEVFTYTMRDASGADATAEVTVTITGQNDAPEAVANAATAIEASGIHNNISGTDPTGNVLINDTDVDAGDTKTVVGVDTGTQVLTSGNVGSIVAGAFGELVIESDGSYTYTVDNDNATVEALIQGESLTETFSYTMQDAAGQQSTTQIVITIEGRTDLPVAEADMDTAVESGGLYNASAGTDPSGNVLDNDSTNKGKQVVGVDAGTTALATGDVGSPVVGTYGTVVIDANGDFTYTLDNSNPAVEALRTSGEHVTDVFTYTMEDDDSNSSTTQLTITIDGNNDAIIATADIGTAVESGGLNNGTTGSDATGNVVTNDTDVDAGDTKTVVGVQVGTHLSTSGSVGASVTGNYGSIVINNNGSYTYTINESLAAVQALRTTTDTLTETYSYTVVDTAGTASTTQLVVTIQGSNDTPTAVVDAATAYEAGGTSNGTAGTDATGNVLTNDTDVDAGDTKTVIGVAAGTTGPANGSVNSVVTGTYGGMTIAGDGSYTYVVDNDNATVQQLRTSGQSVTDTFTYTFTDTDGLSSTTQIVVTVRGANDAIAATADTMTATEAGGTANGTAGTNPTTNILANDTDVDAGDTKSVSGVAAGNVASASGSVGTSVAGLYGSIQISSDGTATYTVDNSNSAVQALLNSGDTLSDVFTYTVQDTDGAESSALITVTIEGANDAPVAAADSGTAGEAGGVANATAGSNATGNVLVNDNAVDTGDTHTVTGVATGVRASTSGNVGSGVVGTYGTLTIDSEGNYTYVVNETNSDVEGLRTSSDTLSEVFSYTTDDDGGLESTAQITITIRGANDAPVAVLDTATATEAGGVANGAVGVNPTGNVLSNDTDVDNGDTRTVTGNIVGATVGAVGSLVDGLYGTITVNSDGSYTYTVDNSNAAVEALRTSTDTLDDVFSYTITDAGGATATGQITITIEGQNDAPTAQAGTNSATEDAGAVAGTLVTVDVDAGETHTYSLVSNTAEGSATVNANGTYSFDPGTDFQDLAAGETRQVTFTYEVSDSADQKSQAVVTITVAGTNDAPVVADQTFSIDENSANATVVGTVSASDIETDGLKYAITGGTGQTAFTIDPNTGQITVLDGAQLDYDTTPSFTLQVEVTDDGSPNQTTTATMTIDLNNLTNALSGTVFRDEGLTTVGAGETVRVLVNGVSAGTGTTDASGNYSINVGPELYADDTIVVFLDDASFRANTYTVTPGGDFSGLDLYADHIMLRNDHGSSLDNYEIAAAIGAYSDGDILFDVTGSALDVNRTDVQLYIGSGQTFITTDDMDVADLKVLGTVEGGVSTWRVGGDVDLTAGTFLVQDSSWVLNFGDATIAAGTTRFANFEIDSTGTKTIVGTVDVDGSLTITSATAINGGEIRVAGNLTSTDADVAGSTTIRLDGTVDQTISGDDIGNGDLFIDKVSGTVTLLDDLIHNDLGTQDVILVAGNFDANGFTVAVGYQVRLLGGVYHASGTIDGRLTVENTSTLHFDINGYGVGNYDTLDVSGNVLLQAGSRLGLDLNGVSGGSIADDALTYGTRTGVFSAIDVTNNPNGFEPETLFDSPSGTMDIRLNRDPVLAMPGPAIDFTEDGGAVAIDPTATVADADGFDFDGGTLTVHFTANSTPNDQLTIESAGNVTISGGDVVVSGTTIGTFSGGDNGSDLVINWNANSTASSIQEVLRTVSFNNSSQNPDVSTRYVRFTLTDGDGGSSTALNGINIEAINDDPINAGSLPTDATVTEDVRSDVDLSSINISDVDDNGNPMEVIISSRGGGRLYGSTGGGVTVTGDGSAVLTLQGTRDALNTFLGTPSNVQFLHAVAHTNGDDAEQLKIDVNDGGNTGTGGGSTITLGYVNVDITPVNDDPSGVPIINGTVQEDQTLTADTSGISDPDVTGAISYQWLRDGSVIAGATSSTYTLGDADVNTRISVEIRYTDGDGTDEGPLTSAETGLVVNVNDAPTISDIGDQTIDEDSSTGDLAFTVGDVETAADSLAVTAASDDQSLVPDGNIVISGTGANRTISVLPAGNRNGGPVTITVSVSDGNTVTQTTFDVTVNAVNDAPTGNVTISGTPAEDQVLTAGNTLADADGLGTVTYQWQRNGVDIFGATANTYTLTQTDVGSNIRVVASYTDGHGTDESVTSSVVGPVANINDTPTGVPTISGVVREDQTLTADTSDISDEDGLGTFTYQWLRNGSAISGATSDSYTLGDADVGNQISVEVRYTDGHGGDEGPLTSAETALVVNVNDAPNGTDNTINVTEDTSYALTAGDFGLTDIDGHEFDLVYIDTLPTSGQLLHDGNPFAPGTAILKSDLDAGRLTYLPALNVNGSAVASFTFRIQDDGGTSNGGNNLDATPNTITIDVVPQNDEQLIVVNLGVEIEEGETGVTITGAMLQTADVEDSPGQIVYTVTTTPSTGTLRRAGAALNVGATFTQADINAGLITYDHNGNEVFADSFDFSVDDSEGGAVSSGSFSIEILPVNDNAPVITSDSALYVHEFATAVTTVTALDADRPDQTLVYTIVGGADADKFLLHAATGELEFDVAPIFRTPTDADANNVYEVVVQVSDGEGLNTFQTIQVEIANVNEAPVAGDDAFTLRQVDTLVTSAGALTVNDSDIDGDAIFVALAGGPANGTLQLQSDGSFSYTPNGAFHGQDSFTYYVTDGALVSNVATVTLEVEVSVPSGNQDSADNDQGDDNSDGDSSESNDNTSGESTGENSGNGGDSQGESGSNAGDASLPGEAINNPVHRQNDSASPVAIDAPPTTAAVESFGFSADTLPNVEVLLVAVPESNDFNARSLGTERRGDNSSDANYRSFGDFLFSPVQTVNPFVTGRMFDLEQKNYLQQRNREESSEQIVETIVVGTTAAVSTSVSVGYAVWLLRGGSLLTSFLSSMPMWQGFDPLPVLESFEKAQRDNEDEESLASLVAGHDG